MTDIHRGTTAFKKINAALFIGGFCTFAILWGMQSLLPEIAEEFSVSPALSSLVQSSTTLSLAITLLIIGAFAHKFDQKHLMTTSLVVSSILVIFSGFLSSFGLLIAFRILQGITLAGIPAVAMAYLANAIEGKSLGFSMGLYISGSSIGGMTGRIVSGFLTDYFSWNVAVMGVGLISLLATALFWYLLPKVEKKVVPAQKQTGMIRSFLSSFKVPGLPYLFLNGFLLSAGFVSLYNYIGFVLMDPPYYLSQTLVGFIFVVYLVGTFSSTWMGMLSDKYGKGRILKLSISILFIGGALTLHPNLWLIVLGIAIFTFGFFGAHSICSSWVSNYGNENNTQATSIYLFAYYFGGSVVGTLSGTLFYAVGWSGIVAMIAALAVLSFLSAFRVTIIKKHQQPA
ncbi:MFS transporter [Alkalihalobacillus sp. LMS6]|uniref:MFS transporter n=1 Tax=Alkalihalobacillus sp. LMS6 TaxID=2924034 RepID=UPI0020D13407|nr:MFS transporter [Alkalihalobacillus sp. LMS6]UTR05959.1 MFS transporter [Alkalihalobacillus sp. LMS6]